MHGSRILRTTCLGVLVLLLAAGAAAANCPPVGTLPNYDPSNETTIRPYGAYEFRIRKGDSEERVTVAGRYCFRSYAIKDGVNVMSDLEIQENYRAQFKKLGAQILQTGDRDTYARLSKGGQETWVYVYSQENAIEVYVVEKQPLKVTLAAPSGKDYRLLGHMPAYEAGTVEKRDFDQATFRVKEGDDTRDVEARGAKYWVNYALKDGAQVSSDLEIQENYRAALKALGAQILMSEGGWTYARLKKGDLTIWMSVYSQETGIEVTAIEEGPLKVTLAAPSGKDYRLLGHMPAYLPGTVEKRNFDKATFRVQEGDDIRDVEARGAKYWVNYSLKDGAQVSSNLEIQENYRDALKALGAQILSVDNGWTYARAEIAGQTIWMSVYSQENAIEVTAIEEKPFQPSIKPAEASALKTALDKDGRVSIYVNFDFAKAALKPDAAPTIAQVVKLLKDNPALKVSIDGHTDNVGGHDYNIKLSGQRAAAVVDALVAQGIARDRMKSAGFGPDKPVGDNATDEGRAKNRRVELVKG